MTRKTLMILATVSALAGGTAAMAQSGPFAPVFSVNGSPVTGFEYEQRKLFLTLLRAPGDIEAQTRQALIEDRLRLAAAKQLGVTLTPDQIKAGMEEFASRANLTADQFVQALAQGGVQAETFRDFVSAGLIWREVVRAKFGGTVTISEADIDRALQAETKRGAGPRVLLSEIVLPAQQGGFGVVQAKALELAESIRSGGNFAEAARQRSSAPSRDNGGALGWMPLTNLPPQVRGAIGALSPGQISEPVVVPGGIALFQMRGTSEGGEIQPGNVTLDYIRMVLPAAEAERVRAEARICDDLYPIARKIAPGGITRASVTANAVPSDVAGVLSGLDANEAAIAGRQGSAAILVMLCERTATVPEGGAPDVSALPEPVPGGAPRIDKELGFSAGPSRDAVRQDLLNQRLNQLSDGYMAELSAQAIVTDAP